MLLVFHLMLTRDRFFFATWNQFFLYFLALLAVSLASIHCRFVLLSLWYNHLTTGTWLDRTHHWSNDARSLSWDELQLLSGLHYCSKKNYLLAYFVYIVRVLQHYTVVKSFHWLLEAGTLLFGLGLLGPWPHIHCSFHHLWISTTALRQCIESIKSLGGCDLCNNYATHPLILFSYNIMKVIGTEE